jgi:hypothetical protein
VPIRNCYVLSRTARFSVLENPLLSGQFKKRGNETDLNAELVPLLDSGIGGGEIMLPRTLVFGRF